MVRLRHFIYEHQINSDWFVQPVTYEYNTQVHHTSQTSLFSLILSRDFLGALAIQISTSANICRPSASHSKLKLPERLRELRDTADKAAITARESFAKHFNRHIRLRPVFCRGGTVYIDSLPVIEATEGAMLDTDPSVKLRPIMTALVRSSKYLTKR